MTVSLTYMLLLLLLTGWKHANNRIVNLSMPLQMAQTLEKRALRHGFATASEYVRFLINLNTELVTADELLKLSARADKEYTAGKLKTGPLSRFVNK